jgi:hypothetical protein
MAWCVKHDEMNSIGRLVFALTACLLLNSCGLINTALRLAPLLMLVEKSPAKHSGGVQQRAEFIENRGLYQTPNPTLPSARQQMAAR